MAEGRNAAWLDQNVGDTTHTYRRLGALAWQKPTGQTLR